MGKEKNGMSNMWPLEKENAPQNNTLCCFFPKHHFYGPYFHNHLNCIKKIPFCSFIEPNFETKLLLFIFFFLSLPRCLSVSYKIKMNSFPSKNKQNNLLVCSICQQPLGGSTAVVEASPISTIEQNSSGPLL